MSTSAKRVLLIFGAIIVSTLLYGLAVAAKPYLYDLGWSFWRDALTYTILIAHVLLWLRTRRGLLHWLGVMLIALGGMIDAIFPWAWDGINDAWVRMPEAARMRVSEIPISRRIE